MTVVSRINIAQLIVNRHGPIFAELIELLAESLRHLGVEVSVTQNELRGDRCNLLLGATCFLPPWDYQAILSSSAPWIVFQSEALDQEDGLLRKLPDYWKFLQSAPHIWDYSERNLAFLAAHGLSRACYVPIGYSRILERIVPAPEQDIDVFFYGSPSPRRNRVIEELRRRGLKVVNAFPAYGSTRDELIARSRIILNVHQFAISPVEQLRISYLLNNRCFVLSERADSNPYGDGVAYCSYEEIPDRCVEYLAPGREAERTRIAHLGYEQLQAIPMRDHIRAALDCFTGRAMVRSGGPELSPMPSPYFRI